MDPIISPARELPAHATGTAFGETLGIEVPTRYSADIHSAVSAMLAVDSLVTPLILGMSGKTVWFSRLVAGLLFMLRSNASEATLQRRLELEAQVGLLVVFLAIRGAITRRPIDRAYLFVAGVTMIADSLMTEVA